MSTALARAAEQQLSEFKSQDVANTAWAAALVWQSDDQLFAVRALAAERVASGLKAQAVANTA